MNTDLDTSFYRCHASKYSGHVPVHGQIYASNEDRFRNEVFSEVLTAFSLEWKDPERLDELLEFIAPSIWVARRFEFRTFGHPNYFVTEEDDIRALGADFKKVTYQGSIVNERTDNKGLTVRVDHDEVAGRDWEERYVKLLTKRLYRNELRRAIGLMDKNFKQEEIKWTFKSNPDADLRIFLSTTTNASGVRPNRLLFGEKAWDDRSVIYESRKNAGAIRAASLDYKEMSRKLIVDEICMTKARHQISDNEKQALINSCVYGFFAEPGVEGDEPSHLKRFITPAENGERFRVYLERHGKYTDLSVEHYSKVSLTGHEGAFKCSITSNLEDSTTED